MVYVDYIRGLAMLTIIYVHTNAALEFEHLTKYVYSFQIWIFFFISGFLCKKLKSWNDYPGFVWKNFVKLMAPYFACLPLNTLLNYLREEPVRALIDNIFYAHLSFGATWFLPAMFLCSMIAVPLLSFSRSWPIPVIAGIGSFALGMFASNSSLISNYFRWQQALAAVPFFLAGAFYRQNQDRWAHLPHRLAGIALLVIGFITCFANDLVHVSRMDLGIAPITFISGTATTIGLFELFRFRQSFRNPLARGIAWTGRHSTGVLCMHLFCIYLNYQLVLPPPWSPAGIWILLIVNIILSFLEMAILITLWNFGKGYIKERKTR